MPDHTHDSILAKNASVLSSFKRELTTKFSHANNVTCHHDGALFDRDFGSAPKFGAKKGRANLIYVGNNPVERQLVKKAEDYRWNFLAYAQSDHPFSEKLVTRNSRWPLRKAVIEVRAQFKAGKPLSYAQLQRLYGSLTKEEKRQLTDFIIVTYNVIDYPEAIRYFDSFEDMINAMHSNTGSEYDLNEVFVGKSDACYSQFATILMETGRFKDIHDVLGLPIAPDRWELFQLLRRKTDVLSEQIAHYLRIPIKRV